MSFSILALKLEYIYITKKALELNAIRKNKVAPLSLFSHISGQEIKPSSEPIKEILNVYRQCITKTFPDCVIRRNTHNISIRISDSPLLESYTFIKEGVNSGWIDNNNDSEILDLFVHIRDSISTYDIMHDVKDNGSEFIYCRVNRSTGTSLFRNIYNSIILLRENLEKLHELVSLSKESLIKKKEDHEETQRRIKEARRNRERIVLQVQDQMNEEIRAITDMARENASSFLSDFEWITSLT